MPSRRPVLLLVAACLAALLPAGVAVADADWDNPPPSRTTRDLTPIPGASKTAPLTLPKPGIGFGFNGTPACDGTIRGGKTDRGLRCDTVRDLLDGTRATLWRTVVSWRDLEPTRDVIDPAAVAAMHHRLDATADSRRKLVAVLWSPPQWASQVPDMLNSAPNNDDGTDVQFRQYVRFVVQEFGARLAAVEVWNEPNLHGRYAGWIQHGGGVNTAHYARLVRLAAQETHALRPDLPVLVGGLVTAVADSSNTVATATFLKHLYRDGLRPRWADPAGGYDGIGVHLYPRQQSGTSDPPDHPEFGMHTALNALFDGYGWADPQASIWVTETGVTTSGCQLAYGRCVYPGAGCGGLLQPRCDPYQLQAVSPWEQANRVEQILRYLHTVPRVRAIIVHSLTDSGGADGGNTFNMREFGFGVLATPDFGVFALKPAYCRIQSLAGEPLRSACPAGSASTGLYDPAPPLAAVPPRLTGIPRGGRTLTSTTGTWDGWPRPTVAIDWLRCDGAGQNCAPIAGSTGATYTVAVADLGRRLRSRAAATNTQGSASMWSSATPVIVADQAPIAVLEPPAGTIYAGRAVSFDARGSTDPEGDALTFRWPDGGTGAQRTLTLPSPGTHSVWVDVSDGVNTVRRTVTVTVLDPGRPPDVQIAPLPRIVKNRPFTIDAQTYTVDPDGDAITTWRWDFDGNGTWDRVTTTGIITHVYPTTGPRTIRAQATDARGEVGVGTASLTVRLL